MSTTTADTAENLTVDGPPARFTVSGVDADMIAVNRSGLPLPKIGDDRVIVDVRSGDVLSYQARSSRFPFSDVARIARHPGEVPQTLQGLGSMPFLMVGAARKALIIPVDQGCRIGVPGGGEGQFRR